MKDLENLEERIGVTFTDKDLLTQSMVHRSYINEHRSFELGHNERLEFLGDAVLELIVTNHLFRNLPDTPEGEMTNLRAALVNTQSLADSAHTLNLEEFLHLSRGEAKDKNPKARSYILANCFEAVIGAIYLDQGYDGAKEFIDANIINKLAHIIDENLHLDPKSLFQEFSQEKEGITPTYKVMDESGPDHDKHFRVGVFLNRKNIAEGEGTSKQEAQVAAAQAGLKAKGWK